MWWNTRFTYHLQGAEAWYLILSKYTRVSIGKIDLLTVSLDVFCDGAWQPEQTNTSIMHGKGKREQYLWTLANKLVKEEFAEMNQFYCLLQEGHGNWPLSLQVRQGILSLGSEERALKKPLGHLTTSFALESWQFCHTSTFLTQFQRPAAVAHPPNSPNLIGTLWAPVIWARKQEMKYRIAM